MQLSLVETTLWLDILKLHMIDLCALSEEEVLRFFVGQRLLKNKMNCDKCGRTMRINKRAKLMVMQTKSKAVHKQIDTLMFLLCQLPSQVLSTSSSALCVAKNYSNMQAAYETGMNGKVVSETCQLIEQQFKKSQNICPFELWIRCTHSDIDLPFHTKKLENKTTMEYFNNYHTYGFT
uniref:Transposase n=1 Tax=Ditylenchus dipsaci TaxID=166011 RepID=A0A915CZ48_9BILA